MKKYIMLLIVAILCLSVSLVYADDENIEDPCQNHVLEFAIDVPKYTAVEWMDNEYHAEYTYYVGVCNHCGATEDLRTRIGNPVEHSKRYIRNEHMAGSTRHLFTYVCDVCGGNPTMIVFCPGPENGGCVNIVLRIVDTPVME